MSLFLNARMAVLWTGLAAAIATIIAEPARAVPLTASDILTEFNAIISNDFTSQHDVEGRLLANRITGGATFNMPRGTAAASSYQAVNANTITNGLTNGNVDNGGNVNYVTSNAGHFNMNGGGTIANNYPSFGVNDFTTPLNALAAGLAKLTSNSAINASDPNNFRFIESPNASGLALFSVSAATLSTARNLIFSGSASTIIINVTGTSFTQSTNFNASDFLNRHIIWNFAGATNLSFTNWHGSVLAGNASVTNSSPIEGMLYAKNFTGGGELHDFTFAGTLPNIDPAPIPEPATPLVLGTGITALGVARLRPRPSAANLPRATLET